MPPHNHVVGDIKSFPMTTSLGGTAPGVGEVLSQFVGYGVEIRGFSFVCSPDPSMSGPQILRWASGDPFGPNGTYVFVPSVTDYVTVSLSFPKRVLISYSPVVFTVEGLDASPPDPVTLTGSAWGRYIRIRI